jgi:hypothetical protein
MKQIIYRSEPFGFDRATLAGILLTARRNNGRDGITGALLCRDDLYLQLIEGPANAIDSAFARIAADDRHCDVTLLLSRAIGERLFPQWEMLDDEMPSLSWSPIEIADGAIENAGGGDLLAIFTRLSESATARAAS